ncbi:Soma ferritin [Amphibalanus amphitrite]|uniref:Ferritin n=1 Tax=Amphibalanus amphitrite TaxID=1232801 RepID=A0A6A4WX86_AMPAM|nr:soma ferritin-like [Amphibalanus amphitrite]KAF0309889.1 Soma ferritin [Amphibalanus amphitrite]
MATVSQCRQNYHEDSEAGVNKQINMELFASYTYMSMASYFDRDDVAFPGFHAYFKKQSDEEREHAEKLMKFQNQRGGRVLLQPIMKPAQDQWGSPLEALQAALELEKSVNQALLNLHKVADSHTDPQMCDFIESEFLTEQVESIKEIGAMITRLKRCGNGLGEYIFDKDLS